MPGEGVLNQRQNRAKARCERGGSAGFACGGGAEPTAKPSESEV